MLLHTQLFRNCSVPVVLTLPELIAYSSKKFGSMQSPSNVHNAKADESNNKEFNDKTIEQINNAKLEMTLLHQAGFTCDPSTLTSMQWKYILTLNSVSARKRYYAYLHKLDTKRPSWESNHEVKKEASRLRKKTEQERRTQNNHIVYGLSHTSLLLRVRKEAIDKVRNLSLWQAKEIGEHKIVLDCAYDSLMLDHVSRYAAEEIRECFKINQKNMHPFDMHICVSDLESTTLMHLENRLPKLLQASFPVDIHTKSVADLFPPEKLIYLTSYSQNVLDKYDQNDIYVIGGAIEKCIPKPASLNRAKELGIRTAKLPLDRYLNWGMRKKQLRLDDITQILLDFRSTRDWKRSFLSITNRY